MPTTIDTLKDRVTAHVEGLLRAGPCFAVDIVVRGQMGSHAVDVFVESDDVLDAHTLANISKELGYIMDATDTMPGPYTLNVSSPGADRPLQLPRQYRKMIGRRLRVHYRQASGSNTEVLGTLASTDDVSVTVTTPQGPLSIQYGQILWARVQLPW